LKQAAVLLDSDTLSELSRAHPRVIQQARSYLEKYGRFTISAITVFERMRGYRDALRRGRPYEIQMRQFQAFAAACIVLPVDEYVADKAANIWAQLGSRERKSTGDILIAATASANHLAIVTRNRKDFEPIAKCEGIELQLTDWTK
jgi:tRNA(fMet)-specific endonuclease VapC